MSDRIPLDDLTSDALDQLYDRLDFTEAALERVRDKLEVQVVRVTRRAEQAEAEVLRLTAGQCLDSRRMCEQHHTPPVTGCPYPQCVAARQRAEQ